MILKHGLNYINTKNISYIEKANNLNLKIFFIGSVRDYIHLKFSEPANLTKFLEEFQSSI